MCLRIWIVSLALLAMPSSLVAQSQLSRQLQQKLNSRKSTPASDEASEAPTRDPRNLSENFSPETPQEYADSLHLAVLTQNLPAFNRLISWPTILQKATSNLDGKPIDEFRETFLKEVEGTNSLGAQIIHTVRQGGSYEFLQLKKNDKSVGALFRMLLPGGKGVNYHEYSLARNQAGRVIASDIYVYLTGEPLTDSIRRNLITALQEKDSAAEVSLSATDKLLAENYAVIKKLNEALAENDATQARDLILRLPKELRGDKAIQGLTLNTYRNSGSFDKVLEVVRKACPDDVFMDMIAIDILVRQKNYKLAIESIERINKKVGGDPYLKILHGRMLLNEGNPTAGRQLIKEAVSEDDGILSGYWNLISFSLQDQDHERTLELLKKVHSRFKIKFKDLREIPSYKDFVKSDQFAEWTRFLETNTVSTPATESDDEDTAPTSNQPGTTKSASRSSLRTGQPNKPKQP